jgi:hypothetical protein
MQFGFSTRQSRFWINLFFIYVSVVTLALGIHAIKHSRNWIISDWLINYQGGFVRRGFPGEIAFRLGHLLHVSPIYIVPVFYLFFIGALIWSTWKLVMRSSLSIWVVAMVVSPATLSFHILHPQAGFKKELIFMAALAVLLVLLERGHLSSRAVVAYLTATIFFGCLSHEALICFLPYWFGALILGGRSSQQATREYALPVLVAGITVFICSRHLGSTEVARQICSSLGYKLIDPYSNDICGSGAIPYLRNTREQAAAEALSLIERQHFLSIYPFFFLLGLVAPIAESVSLTASGLRKEVRITWICAAFSFAASTLLFRYGIDWGRWICVHVVCITLLLLYADGKKAEATQQDDARAYAPSRLGPRVFAAMCVVAYATLWAVPNNLDRTTRMGYFGRVRDRVFHVRQPSASDNVIDGPSGGE